MDYKRAVEIDKELEQLYQVKKLMIGDFHDYQPRLYSGGGVSQALVCDITFRIEYEDQSPTDDVVVIGNVITKKHYHTNKITIKAFADNEIRGYAADFLYKAIQDKISERLKERDKIIGKEETKEIKHVQIEEKPWWKFW